MNDSFRMMITVLLVPVVWSFLQYKVIQPTERMTNKILPENIARILTKKRFEE